MDPREYKERPLEDVVAGAQRGDRQAQQWLITKYRPMVEQQARRFSLQGGEPEDLIQEGLMGLAEAIRDYNEAGGSRFESFAFLCIRRQIYNALEAAARDKHQPLNSYLSFFTPLNPQEAMTLEEVFAGDDRFDPPGRLLEQEAQKEYRQRLSSVLSPLEDTILQEYLAGHSYVEIAQRMGRDVKSVDNAIQRIRKKLAKS
ncbi:RNA polymerase sporulation specific sigma factor SigH [Clostridiaceae bacterium JG1575]|nr:RNA polymerase sporulation specific sigma factor SigH [Clostridiaceae bacterium JG1575]